MALESLGAASLGQDRRGVLAAKFKARPRLTGLQAAAEVLYAQVLAVRSSSGLLAMKRLLSSPMSLPRRAGVDVGSIRVDPGSAWSRLGVIFGVNLGSDWGQLGRDL